MYDWLQIGLGIATAMFIAAFFLGKRHISPWHQTLAVTATMLTVGIGLALIVSVNIVHGGDRAAAGIAPSEIATGWLIIIHRVIATVVFIMMLYQGYLGITKKIRRHGKLSAYFIVLFVIVYISGTVLFQRA